MIVKVYISPKPDILDPQGKAVLNALKDLGYNEVEDVRVGKYITLDLKIQPGLDVKTRLEEMCRRLLANINVESYSIEITEN